jgi:hypothetical protein
MQGFYGVRERKQSGGRGGIGRNPRSATRARSSSSFLIFQTEDAEHDVKSGGAASDLPDAVVPVIGAGNVKRVEDVKKLIYAGCEKAVLNFAKEADIVMLEEVSKRFGKEPDRGLSSLRIGPGRSMKADL